MPVILNPGVRRMADGLAHRPDRLHAIGNGVIPIVGAYALLGLARRAGLFDRDLT
jgi:DNA (cytosine-5)-methyltransferase 1